MAANIEVILTTIGDANGAIRDVIKEHFIKESNGFIAPQIETDLAKWLDELRDDLYCTIEYPYVDKVYRNSYYNYYSSKHYSYQRDCIRVSLFEPKISPVDFLNPPRHKSLSRKYLGYFIIRPTLNALFGRSLVNPIAFETNNFKICSCKINSLVHGVKLETEGFPHSSQDEETIKCAETTIWGIMEYFGNKYAEYKPTLPSKIHKALERFSYQRQLPSNGLTMDQISFALKEFDFGTRVYSLDSYGKKLFNIIDCYVESGIPVIVGLESKIGDIGHAIIAIGKQSSDRIDWSAVARQDLKLFGNDIHYYDTSDIPSKYVVQDDNMSPYRIVSLDKPGQHYPDADSQSYEIDSVVVPLYPKIYLEAFVAKQLALQIIKDRTIGYDFGNDFVFRFYLASSRSFKNHIASHETMDITLKNNILLTKMPKFIWCGEFYSKIGYQRVVKEAVGLVILDATEANQEGINALIFAGYPDRCINLNENNFVNLANRFKKYAYYSNLK